MVTVEQPIEYKLPLLRQTQVNEKAGYTFSTAIRHFLRHDPDVILVGEIRDPETAATAFSASGTGHLVLSTLHTNDAQGAIPRLKDLGVKPFLIADALIGVVSQRLVRRICSNCKETYVPEVWERAFLGNLIPEKLYRGKGCDICSGTGYFGRTLVYEILTIDKEISVLIAQDTEISFVAKEAKRKGFSDMFTVAAKKVNQGVTTTNEAIRVLGRIKSEVTESSTIPQEVKNVAHL